MKKAQKIKNTIKSPCRKKEILNIAQTLFIANGYDKTPIETVITKAGIAKGTFYHYFKSKDDLLDAIVMRFVDIGVEIIKSIVDDPKLTAEQKLYKISTFKYHEKAPTRDAIAEIKKIDNSQLFQKTLLGVVLRLTPIMTPILIQGEKEGSFKAQHPYEAMELMLLISQFVFESRLMPWSSKEIPAKTKAYTHIIEDLFGAKRGSLSYMVTKQKQLLKKPSLSQIKI